MHIRYYCCCAVIIAAIVVIIIDDKNKNYNAANLYILVITHTLGMLDDINVLVNFIFTNIVAINNIQIYILINKIRN